jgi:anti-anti-sigma factor
MCKGLLSRGKTGDEGFRREIKEIREIREGEAMDIHAESVPQGRVVRLVGRLDTKTAPDFEKEALMWVEEGCRGVALDLSGIDYVSSAGLRSILVLAKKLQSVEGRVVLFGMSGVVEEVFSISGFDRLIPVVEDRDAACKTLG